MCIRYAVVLALSCGPFAVSCFQSESSTESEFGELTSAARAEWPTSEPAREAREPLPVVRYDPKDFPFLTIIPDDGKEEGGGWQTAKANLSFTNWVFPHLPRRWDCPLTIGMPLRTKLAGRIPPSRAAVLSVEVAEDVARSMNYELPVGIFCRQLKDGMNVMFRARHPEIGARVTSP